jgi:hypothetical protein
MKSKTIIAFAVIAMMAMFNTESQAAGFGQRLFARTLNVGPLRHAAGYRGAEVVYRSSGRATQAAAMQAWSQSPGHAALINAGKIKNVVCNGRVCVGR